MVEVELLADVVGVIVDLELVDEDEAVCVVDGVEDVELDVLEEVTVTTDGPNTEIVSDPWSAT